MSIAASTQTQTGPKYRHRRPSVVPYFLLLPALVLLIVALGYPLVRQLIMSFQEFGPAQQFGAPAEFAGLSNYTKVLSSSEVWGVLIRTLLFAFACVVATMTLGVAFALLMTRVSNWVRVVFQSVLMVVWAIPVVSSVTVWTWMFDAKSGIVNDRLAAIGLPFENFAWLFNPASFFFVAGVIVTWMSVPLVVLMVYAALMQIDPSVLEAAKIDGASGWRLLTDVTMPSIAPILMLVTLLQVIWDLRVFAQISILQSAGGDTRGTHVLGTYVYQLGIGQNNYGTASAVAMLLLVLTLLITGGYLRLLLRDSKEL